MLASQTCSCHHPQCCKEQGMQERETGRGCKSNLQVSSPAVLQRQGVQDKDRQGFSEDPQCVESNLLLSLPAVQGKGVEM
jgi:hypothetical protein